MDQYVLSVDLGGTNVRVAIIDKECNVIKVYREPSEKNDNDKLANQICRMIENLPYQEYNIHKVGVSSAGFIKESVIQVSFNNGVYNLNLKKAIESRFPDLTAEVRNDANATALSEATFGSTKEYDDSIFITISSGIGGGIVMGKKLVDIPFEIGHTFIEYQNQAIELEKILSGNGIVKLCNDNGLVVSKAYEFFALVEESDEHALKILDYWMDQTARYIANIQMLYNCQAVVLSGGVMKSGYLFFTQLKAKTNEYLKPFPVRPLDFTVAQFDQDAGLMGGAAVAFNMD